MASWRLERKLECVTTRRGARTPKWVYEAHAGFRFALRQFLRYTERTARSAGLTPQQFQVLLAVQGFPGRDRVRVGELAKRLQILHHSAVGLVDGLVARGLIVREHARTDRRVVLLHLTGRGLRLLKRVSAANRRELRRLTPQFLRFLERLAGSKTAVARSRDRKSVV